MRSREPLFVEVGQLLRSELGAQQKTDISLSHWKTDDLGEVRDIEVTAALSKIDDEVLRLEGTARVTVRLSCDRCLKDFDQSVSAALDEVFSTHPQIEQWQIGGDNVLDLREPLRQQILLSLPTHPLCSPDCPGLCQICGKELRDCHHSPNRDTLSPQVKVSKLKDR